MFPPKRAVYARKKLNLIITKCAPFLHALNTPSFCENIFEDNRYTYKPMLNVRWYMRIRGTCEPKEETG